LANDYQPQKEGGTVDKTFTAIAASTDLRAQSGYPTHAPGRVTASNASVDTAADVVYTDLRGNSNTFQVPPEAVHTLDYPVATLEAATGDALDITATWWLDSTTRFNP
jgi:ABC-type Fe3+-hydroxamate transport system substrate-binding protein